MIALVIMGFAMVSFNTVANEVIATELSVDGDCDKCKDKKCDGTCDKQEHKCTDECKKDGKCSHATADHKCTDECKKDGKCTHAEASAKTTEGEKKACSPKKACGSSCGGHK